MFDSIYRGICCGYDSPVCTSLWTVYAVSLGVCANTIWFVTQWSHLAEGCVYHRRLLINCLHKYTGKKDDSMGYLQFKDYSSIGFTYGF